MGCMGIMEKKMETIIVIGFIMEKKMETPIAIGLIMEKKMETTIIYWGHIGVADRKLLVLSRAHLRVCLRV